MENSRAMIWTGRTMSGVVILFMVFDVTIKYLDLPIVEQTGIPLGLPPHSAQGLAVMETVILLVYLWPRTAILGAVLFTIALRDGELSVLYPVISLTYVWVAILSVPILHENFNLYTWKGASKIVGIMTIVSGVAVLGRGSKK